MEYILFCLTLCVFLFAVVLLVCLMFSLEDGSFDDVFACVLLLVAIFATLYALPSTTKAQANDEIAQIETRPR